MQITIPKELMQYVRMSKKEGLVHHPDMPKELLPLFEKTRKEVVMLQQQHMEELRSLLVKPEIPTIESNLKTDCCDFPDEFLKKRILRGRYGIDWQTPAESNPDIMFD